MTKREMTKLEYARRCRGESGQEFGTYCKVAQRFISKAENGRGMSELHLQRVADYLGWKGDPHELLQPVDKLKEVTANV